MSIRTKRHRSSGSLGLGGTRNLPRAHKWLAPHHSVSIITGKNPSLIFRLNPSYTTISSTMATTIIRGIFMHLYLPPYFPPLCHAPAERRQGGPSPFEEVRKVSMMAASFLGVTVADFARPSLHALASHRSHVCDVGGALWTLDF